MTFTVYSKPGCTFCEKMKQVLVLEELKHVVYELGRDFTREEFYDSFGEGSTFPQVMMDEKNLGGCKESLLYMKENKLCCTT